MNQPIRNSNSANDSRRESGADNSGNAAAAVLSEPPAEPGDFVPTPSSADACTTRLSPWFFVIFAALNFLFLLTSSGRVRTRDELNADLQAESLATRGSTAIPQSVNFFFYGKYDRDGQPQPPYGPAHAAFLIPWYYTGRALLAVVPGIPYRARDVVMDATLVASSATFAALAAALAFLILARIGISYRVAGASALLLALATPLFAYSALLYSEPLTCVLVLAAAAALFTNNPRGEIGWQEATLAGILLGAMIWVRPAHLIAAPVFLVALLARDGEKGWRAVRITGAIVGMFGLAYLWRNHYLFGDFFDFGYPSVSDGGKNMNSFDTPILTGLLGFLLSPGKSVFLFAPPIVVAISGIRRLARLDKGLAVVAAGLPLVYLPFYSMFTQWEGGFCIGPRYLLPAIAALSLGLGPALERSSARLRRSAIALGVLGFLVQSINLATSFFEDQANGRYYDIHYNYRMSYNPLVSMTRQLIFYIRSSHPAAPGLGFDRWFVFLYKAGVSPRTLGVVLTLEILSFGYFALWLAEVLLKDRRSSSGPAVSPLPNQ